MQPVRLPGQKFSRDNSTSTQSSYRKALERVGLFSKGESGALSSWMPQILQAESASMIEKQLGLKVGSYTQGRKRNNEHFAREA